MATLAAPSATVLPPDVRWMRALANLMFAVAALLLLALALAVGARWPGFALRAIRLEGELTRNSVSTVRANVAHKLAGGFFTLDLQRARAAFESVPWVRRAVVSRAWPGRLVVRLQEHQPAALWLAGDGIERLVNSHGEVFEANVGDVEDDALPQFAGPAGRSAAMLAMYHRLAPVLRQAGGEIDKLSLSGRGSWQAVLDSGAAIELGRGSDDEVLARSERFARTLAQVSGRFQRPLVSADLRHADGYAVRLRGVVTQAPGRPGAPKTGN